MLRRLVCNRLGENKEKIEACQAQIAAVQKALEDVMQKLEAQKAGVYSVL